MPLDGAPPPPPYPPPCINIHRFIFNLQKLGYWQQQAVLRLLVWLLSARLAFHLLLRRCQRRVTQIETGAEGGKRKKGLGEGGREGCKEREGDKDGGRDEDGGRQ